MSTPRRPLLTRFAAALLPALFSVSLLSACGGTNPFHQTATTITTGDGSDTTTGTGLANNDYLPDSNLSSYVNTNERPGCGSSSKGGWRMYLVFAALIGGVGFVMWRIARGVRQRDLVVNAEPDTQPPAGSTSAGE